MADRPKRVRATATRPEGPMEQFFTERGFGARMGFGERPAVLVVDFINAFTDPSMPLGVTVDAEIEATNALLAAAREAEVGVFYTVEYFEEPDCRDAGLWALKQRGVITLAAGTPQVELDQRLDRRDDEPIIVKKYASPFFGTDLIARLNVRRIDTLLIAGVTTSGCVRAAAVDAMQLGIRPIVIREAVGDRVRQAHLQSLFDLDQKFADVVSLDEAVAYFRTVKRSPATSPGLGKRTRGQDAPGVDPRSESLVFQTFVDDVLRAVHATPELTFEEVQTAALLSERLESLEARIRTPVEGLPTCFRAEVGSEDGPKVGIVVPLDAVPMHVGGSKGEPFDAIRPVHACGHQVIAAAVLGAVQLLSASSRPLQGCLVVMGIPGDEIHAPQVRAWGGGKALTAQAGAWDDLDAVLYAHPEFLDTVWGSSRWMSRQCIRLQGRRALGGDGRNVETVFAELLRASRTLAQRYGSEWIVIEAASFEGDVEDGSPCGAEVSILVYGHESEELRERLAALRDLVQEAGNGTDLAPQVAQQGPIYEGLLPNEQLRSAIASAFGDSYVSASAELPFATDFGNLTRRIPGVLIGIGRPGGWRFHTEEAAEEFASRDGHEIAARLAHVLATSVPELLSDRELLARARAEFESRRAEA